MNLTDRLQHFMYKRELPEAMKRAAYHGIEKQLPAGNPGQYDYFIQYAANEFTPRIGLAEEWPDKFADITEFLKLCPILRDGAKRPLTTAEKVVLRRAPALLESMAEVMIDMATNAGAERADILKEAGVNLEELLQHLQGVARMIPHKKYPAEIQGVVQFLTIEAIRHEGLAPALRKVAKDFRALVLNLEKPSDVLGR